MTRSERNELRDILRQKVYRSLRNQGLERPRPTPSAKLAALAEKEGFYAYAKDNHPEWVAYAEESNRRDEQVRELQEEIILATFTNAADIKEMLENFDKKIQALNEEWSK